MVMTCKLIDTEVDIFYVRVTHSWILLKVAT